MDVYLIGKTKILGNTASLRENEVAQESLWGLMSHSECEHAVIKILQHVSIPVS